MSTILNPTPVTTGVFDGMYITKFQVSFDDDRSGYFVLNFLPYDGSHLLVDGGKYILEFDLVAKRKADPQFDAMLTSVVNEMKVIRAAGMPPGSDGNQVDLAMIPNVRFIQIISVDPTKPLVAQVFFNDGVTVTIDDCYERAGADPVFAGVFLGAIYELARQGAFPTA